MASKVEWKDALQDLATFANVGYLETDSGRLGGIKERHPKTLALDIAEKIDDLKKTKAEVQIVNAQRIAAEDKAREARIEARDKGYEVEDLEYQNRALKALLWLAYGGQHKVRRTESLLAVQEALALTKDYEAEVIHDLATGAVTLTFLPESDNRNPMAGIGWHNFESKED